MEPRFRGPGHHSENDLGGAHARLVERCEKQTTALGSLGQDLRKARQRMGLELSQISSSLKISKRYLNAIEESDVAALPPGDVYLIGYTRAYAGYLGLNTGHCVEKLKIEIAAREAECQMSIAKEPTPKNRLPSAVRHTFGFLGIL